MAPMIPNEPQYGIVLVTAGSQEEAQTIARILVETHLAACVSLLPIQSVYTWNGEIQSDQEWQLLIKTDLAKFSALEIQIKELHSYEVPEIVALPIVAGSMSYLNWIGEQM
jgi:periplasmic divalent cation tolerance protein